MFWGVLEWPVAGMTQHGGVFATFVISSSFCQSRSHRLTVTIIILFVHLSDLFPRSVITWRFCVNCCWRFAFYIPCPRETHHAVRVLCALWPWPGRWQEFNQTCCEIIGQLFMQYCMSGVYVWSGCIFVRVFGCMCEAVQYNNVSALPTNWTYVDKRKIRWK